ncbi:caspase-3-like isoform X2 [Mercenaria mercenaria]|uniref:caspase-3-like isoform X2 n=1 Tax=Mercenaria mercenaria TaxID=6596 RepID=UPI00234F6E70|nr:caspase-3-like isoform X2 [Mercenaria mercenaria]
MATMDQVTDNMSTLGVKEDVTDASVDTGGTCSVSQGKENVNVDAGVAVIGEHEVAREEQMTQHDAEPLDIEGSIDVLEARGDQGAASTDARVLGCLGATDSGQKVSSVPTVSQTLDAYDMNHKYRGHALLINNEKFHIKLRQQGLGNRDGSSVDERSMKKKLNDLGFSVTGYPDLTANQMKSVCSKMAAKDHSECDCFVCVILSHGEEGVVYGTDKIVDIKELTQKFKGDVCPSLVGKPKIFIIQACRGYQTDPGVNVNVADAKGKAEAEPAMVRLPVEADFLFAYSTVPGYYSWRNGMNGSWFIQALAKALEDFGKTMELRKLLTLVNKKVAQNFQSFNPENKDFHKMKQIPCITSMLTKDVYFSTTKRKKVM